MNGALDDSPQRRYHRVVMVVVWRGTITARRPGFSRGTNGRRCLPVSDRAGCVLTMKKETLADTAADGAQKRHGAGVMP